MLRATAAFSLCLVPCIWHLQHLQHLMLHLCTWQEFLTSLEPLATLCLMLVSLQSAGDLVHTNCWYMRAARDRLCSAGRVFDTCCMRRSRGVYFLADGVDTNCWYMSAGSMVDRMFLSLFTLKLCLCWVQCTAYKATGALLQTSVTASGVV
jgi:hypothetical protein